MSRLSLNIDFLNTTSLRYIVPGDSNSTLFDDVKKKFHSWTGAEKTGSIHSGYRRVLLAHDGIEESKRLAQKLRESFDTMVVLGIGGSALGARMGLTALQWAVPHAERRRVIIIDNLDPIEFTEQWNSIEPSRSCFVIISKSGNTLETMSQASVILERLESLELSISRHVVAITDSESGSLRKWANAQSLSTLSVPSDVGGRYSVLTPVGLLPLAFAGIDIQQLCSGCEEYFQNLDIDLDRVAQFAIRLSELELGGFAAHALMPYSTKLKDLGLWFVQLWGESLGKKRPGGGSVGSIPIAAVGATDQHSLLQLLMEGPNRIVTGFVLIEEWPQLGSKRPAMNRLPTEFASLSFAHGKTFAEILNAEGKATQAALQEKSHPTYSIYLKDASAESVGALLGFYMDLVVMTAAALDVNPFDQPGVELGKKILPTLL